MTMSDYRVLSALMIISLMTPPVVIMAETSPEPSAQDATEIEFVTKENSPQFAKDFAEIDTQWCEVWGWGESGDKFHAKTAPQDAESAHSLLKRLLVEHPLRQDCDLPSSKQMTAKEHSLYFRKKSQNDRFVFSIGFYLDGLVELIYHPENEPENESIGVVIGLDGKSKAEYYSVLADCLAEGNPEASEEFRQKAAAIRRPILVIYALLSVVLGVIVLVAVLSLWSSLKKQEANPDNSDDAEPQAT